VSLNDVPSVIPLFLKLEKPQGSVDLFLEASIGNLRGNKKSETYVDTSIRHRDARTLKEPDYSYMMDSILARKSPELEFKKNTVQG
jgi:hypothetical protein